MTGSPAGPAEGTFEKEEDIARRSETAGSRFTPARRREERKKDSACPKPREAGRAG
jgi:hypothetical protein